MIRFSLVEPDLTPQRVDERLAAGWFPFSQFWMTCRLWPDEVETAVDTVWIRTRLTQCRSPDRHRKRLKEGMSVEWSPQPVFDAEHQALYERFRTTHPTWRTGPVSGLLYDEGMLPGPLMARTREIRLRDRSGRLLAFRWYLEGKDAVAGITAVFDPDEPGAGTSARWAADQRACADGFTLSYPGYVRPGAREPWHYKLAAGRTEWLDPETGLWRDWDADEPDPNELLKARMREKLAVVGPIEPYPAWANPWYDARSRELPAPWFVRLSDREVLVWEPVGGYRALVVQPGVDEGRATLQVVGIAPQRA
jgi:hypothetical protein